MHFSAEQILSDYKRDGVVRLRQFFSPEEVKRVRQELETYTRDIAPRLAASEVTFEADGRSARNLWHMERHSLFFAHLARQPEILDVIRPLLRGEPVNLGVETFSKPARIGSGVPPHQDNAYFSQQPPDVLTVWVAMDAATEGNGPVYYALGSHRLGMLPHQASGVKGNSIGLADKLEHTNPFIGLLEPGDALVHHCQTVHYSGPNVTDHPRCGLLMVYRGAHTETDPTLKAAYDHARTLT